VVSVGNPEGFEQVASHQSTNHGSGGAPFATPCTKPCPIAQIHLRVDTPLPESTLIRYFVWSYGRQYSRVPRNAGVRLALELGRLPLRNGRPTFGPCVKNDGFQKRLAKTRVAFTRTQCLSTRFQMLSHARNTVPTSAGSCHLLSRCQAASSD